MESAQEEEPRPVRHKARHRKVVVVVLLLLLLFQPLLPAWRPAEGRLCGPSRGCSGL